MNYRIFIGLFTLFIMISCASDNSKKWSNVFSAIEKKYPNAPVHDVLKLLFISQFGNNHLLMDTTRAKTYFMAEWNSISPDSGCLLLPLRPDSAWFLLDLKVARYQHFEPEALWKVIKRSALFSQPDTAGFIQAVHHYKKYALKNAQLTDKELHYMDSLTVNIPPYIHHSKEFKQKFAPAYRIVYKEAWTKFTNR